MTDNKPDPKTQVPPQTPTPAALPNPQAENVIKESETDSDFVRIDYQPEP